MESHYLLPMAPSLQTKQKYITQKPSQLHNTKHTSSFVSSIVLCKFALPNTINITYGLLRFLPKSFIDGLWQFLHVSYPTFRRTTLVIINEIKHGTISWHARGLFLSLKVKVHWFPWAWWVGLPLMVKTPHRWHNIMSFGPSNHQYTHLKTSCLTQIFGSVKLVALASTILHIHQKWGISLPLANETIF